MPTCRRRRVRALAAVAVAAALASCGGTPPEFDVVLRGGHILDGTGAPARPGDVGVKGDRI
ncbi:MAG TPA: hypothetical protein VMF13_22445, partial [Luteitalea sp.]|nr:hypothetical protein [Luteitalea sp.]